MFWSISVWQRIVLWSFKQIFLRSSVWEKFSSGWSAPKIFEIEVATYIHIFQLPTSDIEKSGSRMTKPSSCWKMSEQIRRGGNMSPITIRLWRSCPSLQTNDVSEYVWLLTNSWTKVLLYGGWDWCFFFNLEAVSQELIVTFFSWADSNSQVVVHGRDVCLRVPHMLAILAGVVFQ